MVEGTVLLGDPIRFMTSYLRRTWRPSRLLRSGLLVLSLAVLVTLVFSQVPLQVGYVVTTADPGNDIPVGTALFSSTNT